jgi:hypothetical protein
MWWRRPAVDAGDRERGGKAKRMKGAAEGSQEAGRVRHREGFWTLAGGNV